MKFNDLRAYCNQNDDNPVAVEKFIKWVIKNLDIWNFFEAVAHEQMQTMPKGDPMICMGVLRKRHSVMVKNACSPGLCRMFNVKYKRRFFDVQKMRTFKEAA